MTTYLALHNVTLSFRRLILLPALLLAAVSGASPQARAADTPIPYSNVANMVQARATANRIAEKILEERKTEPRIGTSDYPILIQHIGNRVPEELKWIAVNLKMRDIEVDLVQLKPSKIREEIDARETETKRILETLTYSKTESQENSKVLEQAFANTRESFDKFWGLPEGKLHGLSYFAERIPISPAVKKADSGRGIKAGLIAAASMTTSFVVSFLVKGTPLDLNVMAHAATTLGFWVNYNVANFRTVGAMMGQGKKLVLKTVKGEPKWTFEATNSFFMFSRFIMGLVTNAMITAAIDVNKFADPNALFGIFSNAGIGLFARFKIDKAIQDRTPVTKDSTGKIVVREGEFSEKAAGRIRFWWENLFGVAKNLDLVAGPNWVLRIPYYALFVINMGWVAGENFMAMVASSKAKQLQSGDDADMDLNLECRTILKRPKFAD